MPDSGPWSQFQASAPAAGPWSQFAAAPADIGAPKQSGQLTGPFGGGRVGQALESFGLGVDEGGAGLDDFIAHALPFPGLQKRMDAQVQGFENREASDRAAEGRGGVDIANIAGQIASPVNFAPVGDVGKSVGLTEKLVKLGVQGGVSGAAAPDTQPAQSNLSGLITGQNGPGYWTEKLKQIGEGAGASLAGGAILHGLAQKVERGGSEAADLLRSEGVNMTPGQAVGGIPKRFEDAVSKWPVVGNVIRGGQNRSLESFNIAAVNRALAPIGQAIPKGVKAGNDAISYARQAIGDAYDQLNAKSIGILDKPMMSEIMGLMQKSNNLPIAEKADFGRILQNEVLANFTSGGRTTGTSVKNMESQLGQIAKAMYQSPDYRTRQLAGAVKELQQSVVRMRDRVNPALAGEFQKVNAAYANFKRVQKAATFVGAKDGVFTPSHLLNAVKTGDFTKDKRAFSEGDALMQDLASAGKAVLPNSIADSGTAERLGWAGLGAFAVSNPIGALGAAAGAAAAAVPYTSGGMALLSKFGGPATRNYLAGLFHGATPYVAGGLRASVTDGANQPANQ
jgi:hypothetical protein